MQSEITQEVFVLMHLLQQRKEGKEFREGVINAHYLTALDRIREENDGELSADK